MNKSPASPASPPPQAVSDAAAPGLPSSSDWTERYFQALAQHRQKARAALASGQPLPVVVRRRRVDPAFAQHEAEILECLADVLESEAIRRATATGPIHKVCSDALLNRLLKIFHPKYGDLLSREHTAAGAPSHCLPQRPIRAKGDFNFETALQRLEFRKWEREQAIAVALDLFYMSPEELDSLCPVPRPVHRGMTKWPGSNPPSAPAEPTVLRSLSNEPCPTIVAAAGRPQNPETNLQPHSEDALQSGSRCPNVNSKNAQRSSNSTEATLSSVPNHPQNHFRAGSHSHPSLPNTPTTAPSGASAPAAVQKSPPSSPPSAAPHEPRRRLLFGLAMPPGSKTGVTLYPGFIPPLIRAGVIKPPGLSTQPPRPGSPDSS